MRYVCTTCGEGDLYKASDKRSSGSRPVQKISEQHEDRQRGSSSSSLPSPSVSVASDDSDETEWAGAERGGRNTLGEADSQAYRGRSASMSTRASREAVSGRGGDPYESWGSASGFELCASCIESHGISHAKAAVAANRRARADQAANGVRAASEMRHCFREKLWGLEGWTDIGKSSGRMVSFGRRKLTVQSITRM